MKIKLLAAMMALASTGVMAELVITDPISLDGATESSSVTYNAEAVVPNMCVIGSATGAADLGFGKAPTNSANFTVLSNAAATYTITTEANNTSKLEGGVATVKYVAGTTATELPTNNSLTFTNGASSLNIGVMLEEEAHQLTSGTQTVSTMVTIDCGSTEGEGV